MVRPPIFGSLSECSTMREAAELLVKVGQRDLRIAEDSQNIIHITQDLLMRRTNVETCNVRGSL